jgi:hypothetical protein
MILKENYLSLVKSFVNNGFLKPNDVNLELGQISPLEQGFIYSITKEAQASKTILAGIQLKDLDPLEKKLYLDSIILNFLASNPGPKYILIIRNFGK